MVTLVAEVGSVVQLQLAVLDHAVLVPPSLAFDRQLALDRASVSAATTAATPAEPAEKQKSAGFGGFMKKLKTVALEAGKQMDKRGQSSGASAPPQQSTLVVITDEVKNISTGAVAATMFAPPDGYREVKPRSR